MRKESQSVLEDVINNLLIVPTTDTHLELTTKIAERALGRSGLDLTHSALDPRTFTVGEFCPRFALGNGVMDSLNGKHVYITLTPGPYKNAEQLVYRAGMIARAAREGGAGKAVILATDFPHGRQDRGPAEDPKALGELATVDLHADFFRISGAHEVITTHAHSPRIAAFFAVRYGLVHKERPDLLAEEAKSLRPEEVKIPQHVDMDNKDVQELGKKVFKSISPHAILADYILHQSSLVGSPYLANDGARLALKAVDAGDWVFISNLHGSLYLPNAVKIRCSKGRKAKNDENKLEVAIEEIYGELLTLNHMMELLADDGSDTSGTLIKTVGWSQGGNLCAKTGKGYGVPENRFVYFTHAWLGGDSYEIVQRRIVKQLPCQELVFE